MKRIGLIVVGILAVALIGLYAIGRSSPGGSDVAITEADNGKTLTLARGEMITLTLDSNVTTGFKWNLTTPPDAAVLQVAGSEYKGSASRRAGAGGTEVWTFKAAGPGTASVKLGYYRPEEKSPRVAQEYGFTVAVK